MTDIGPDEVFDVDGWPVKYNASLRIYRTSLRPGESHAEAFERTRKGMAIREASLLGMPVRSS